MGCCFTSSYYIVFDSSQKIIILKKERIFKCIKKSQIIQINDIGKVIFRKYTEHDSGKYFKVNLILANGIKVTAVDIFDNGGEYRKAFQKLKKAFPEEKILRKVENIKINKNINKYFLISKAF